jgi:hypothetical protein
MGKLFRGQIDISMFLPMVIGMIYAGTGGWSESRWTAALAIMGLGPAARIGYERGYWTENPEISRSVQSRELVVDAPKPATRARTQSTKRPVAK